MKWVSKPSPLKSPVPIAPTCCWIYGTGRSLTAATSLVVWGRSLMSGHLSGFWFLKKISFVTNVFVSRSSKFPLGHVTPNYEPLHKRNTGICILTKTNLVIKPFKVHTKIRWSNLNHNLRKTHRGRSSLFMMRMKGLPSRQPPPCVSAESIISLCYQEVSVTLARAFIFITEPFGAGLF